MSTDTTVKGSVGVAMKRKEDPRFIQGKGNYVDDLSFPGMLYMAIVRSPYPHAEIVNIDIAEALKVPGVKAVITGKDLEAAGLGWLPTFHGYDKQMVLAIGRVLFQYQEVAAVFADSRGAAADGVEAVQVEYNPLPVVADPFTAKKDEVLLRPDREAKTNHIYHWEVGDKERTAQALDASAKVVRQRMWFPRCHPAPLEPCGCVAQFDTMGRLTFHVTSQAPHVYRTAITIVTGIPEDKIRVISPDLGGGFGNKVPVYPGYVCAIVGALKLGKPGEVDRVAHREPHQHRLRTRLPHGRGDWRDGRRHGHRAEGVHHGGPWGVRRRRGSFEVSSRDVRHRHRQLHVPGRARGGGCVLHEQGARAASPTAARSASPRPATPSSAAWTSSPTSSASIRSSCAGRTSCEKISSRMPRRWASPTTAATTIRRSTSRWRRSATRPC